MLAWLSTALLATLLAACRGSDDEDKPDRRSQAERAGIGELRSAPGATVFVANLSFSLRNYGDLTAIAYSIEPRAGTWSKPLAVSVDKSWLDRRGAYQSGSARLELPVFGLYAAHANGVKLRASFRDGSQHDFRATVSTAPYAGRPSCMPGPTSVPRAVPNGRPAWTSCWSRTA
ncbi:aryl-sulfate sulfotransferase N-terminal domain-containing protein [Massilia sp. IC2-477]|uniref:aryl-sulfate sulfotransferase N-terminal domain-containing protein n=1 Tax=Massilia sp. IC2-477 TaxID=2887198 RepID=UPI001D11C3AB|nr:aryl-sulfate sulfotransferase N-terminal domain-containing protein [Massilia sp. IC2-477]MCC2955264.1 aryl-sulfate sulfotransferase N-terminal domain-containing protein [Massilia sp. IC2-477]